MSKLTRHQGLTIIEMLIALLLVAVLIIATGTIYIASNEAWRAGQEKLTMLLSISALGRTLVFLANAAGWRPRWRPALSFEPAEPDLRMLINALLMAVIFVFLVRASWIPWWRRITGRSKAH